MAKSLRRETADKFGGVINTEALGRYVDRIEALHIDRDDITASIKAVYDEAKSAGFVTTIMRQIVRERRMEEDERHDHYALLDSYRSALGMFADTPLGAAAMARAADERAGPPRARRPRPFAEQPLNEPRRRGRPRKNGASVDDALARARAHFNGDDDLPPAA